MLYGLILLFAFVGFSVSADTLSMSAIRNEKIDYTVYEKKASLSITGIRKSQIETALSSARLFGSTPVPQVSSWESIEAMEKLFLEARDKRWLEYAGRSLRRIPWMYPDDGCFARAGLLNKYFFQLKKTIPAKIFAFGNLSVTSPFSLKRRVGWWYHTAPIVSVSGQKYVLDPSVELSRPLPLEDWLRRMGEPSQIKIAICSSGTFLPVDDCKTNSDGTEARASSAKAYYLSKEEKRVRNLNLNASEVLGDNPPW